jgi:beta-galactosidase beta subunit
MTSIYQFNNVPGCHPSELCAALSVFSEVQDILPAAKPGVYAYDDGLVLKMKRTGFKRMDMGHIPVFWHDKWHDINMVLKGRETVLCFKQSAKVPQWTCHSEVLDNYTAVLEYSWREALDDNCVDVRKEYLEYSLGDIDKLVLEAGSCVHIAPKTVHSAGFLDMKPNEIVERLCVKVADGYKYSESAEKIQTLRAALSR